MRSIGLFRRKEVWVPTLRGWVLLLIVGIAAGLLAITTTVPFLAPVQPKGNGILIVEGWLPDYALEQAKQVFERRSYRLMIVTGIPIDHGLHISVEKDYAQLARGILRDLGMDPELIVPVSCTNVPRNRTYATAQAARLWLDQSSAPGPVDVFTLGVHARRTWLLYSMALGDRYPVGIISGADQRYDPDRWWTTSSGVRTVMSEVIAYLYAKLFFYPGSAEAREGG